MTNPNILLAGAGGQVGREIQRTARQNGTALLACDRAALDITDAAAVDRLVRQARPAVIVNAAAYTAVDRAEDEPELAFRVNRDGAACLARAAATAGIPLIHLSTDYVFDGTRPQAYAETDPPAPLGVYGQSKWEGEEAVRRHQPHHLIVRVSWVFGFYGHNFVKTILRLAATRDTLRVVADQAGGPTYAGHIAALMLDLAARAAQPAAPAWGTYHFCGRPITTWHGLAAMAIETGRKWGLLDHPVAVEAIATQDYPTRARRPANSALDCRKIEAAFGPAPHQWLAGLEDMLERTAQEDK